MKFQIKDINESSAIIEIEAVPAMSGLTQPAVRIFSRTGFVFLHSMRTDQARFMAAALVMAAEQAEALANEQTGIKHLPSDDTEGGGV